MDADEDIRFDDSHKKGGKICTDKEMIKRIRRIAKEILK